MAQLIDDVMRALSILEFPEAENYETIAGFMMYILRKIPKRTDSVNFAGYKFEVVDIDNYKIDQLLVTQLPTPLLMPICNPGSEAEHFMQHSTHELLRHWRRDFHRFPEPAWCEYRTTSLIAAALAHAGYEIQTRRSDRLHFGGHGSPY